VLGIQAYTPILFGPKRRRRKKKSYRKKRADEEGEGRGDSLL
jgi:hypothetical protein